MYVSVHTVKYTSQGKHIYVHYTSHVPCMVQGIEATVFPNLEEQLIGRHKLLWS